MDNESSSFKTSLIFFSSIFLTLLILAFTAVFFFSDETQHIFKKEAVVEEEPEVEQVEEDVAFFYRKPEEENTSVEEEDSEENKKLISVTDAAFALYRSPKTRLSVEWFYSELTGNREVAMAILNNADKFNIPFPLAFSLAHAESRFKVRAYNVNTNGTVDRGLFQLNSSSFPFLTEGEFFNPSTSAYYGLSHLNYCIGLGGNEIAGLAMYNAGQGKVRNSGTPYSTLNYIYSIESYKEKIEQNFTLEVLSYYTSSLYYEDFQKSLLDD